MFDLKINDKVLVAGLPHNSEYNLVNNKIGKVINFTTISDENSTYFIASIIFDDNLFANINLDFIYKLHKNNKKFDYINHYVKYFKDHQIINYNIFVDDLIQHNILAYDRYGGIKYYLTSSIN